MHARASLLWVHPYWLIQSLMVPRACLRFEFSKGRLESLLAIDAVYIMNGLGRNQEETCAEEARTGTQAAAARRYSSSSYFLDPRGVCCWRSSSGVPMPALYDCSADFIHARSSVSHSQTEPHSGHLPSLRSCAAGAEYPTPQAHFQAKAGCQEESESENFITP